MRLSADEIVQNFAIKNRQILEEKSSQVKDETGSENKADETE